MFFSKQADFGPYLGRHWDNGTLKGMIHYPGPKHLFTVAPPGSGKSAGVAIPSVAHLRRSMIIIDPKGEIAAVTARARAKMGRVVMLNPCQLHASKLPHLKSTGWNPCPTMNPKSDGFVSDADAIAEAMIPIDNDSQPFFPKAARNLTSAAVMWERISRGHAANLFNVRRDLTAPTSYGRDKKPDAGFLKTVLDMAACSYAPISNRIGPIAERLADDSAGTTSIRDVIGSAVEGTKFIDSPPMAADLQGPGFDFADMRKEITTIYVILPANELHNQAIWLRMVINCALRALYANVESKLPPVLFLLDEFFAIGKLDMITTALAYARGSRIQLWPFLQDLNQLRTLYPNDWQSFLSSSGAVTAFAPKDWFTAEELAKLGGERSAVVENTSTDHEGRISTSRTVQGFPLIRPEDLMRMAPGYMLCYVEPAPFPFYTYAPPYPSTPFGKGLDPNPYFRK